MKSKADIQENFQDILLVDEEGKIEYFKIKAPDYFDLYPEDLIGKKIPQLYSNLDEETSTLMRIQRRLFTAQPLHRQTNGFVFMKRVHLEEITVGSRPIKGNLICKHVPS